MREGAGEKCTRLGARPSGRACGCSGAGGSGAVLPADRLRLMPANPSLGIPSLGMPLLLGGRGPAACCCPCCPSCSGGTPAAVADVAAADAAAAVAAASLDRAETVRPRRLVSCGVAPRAEGGSGGRPWRALLRGLGVVCPPGLDRDEPRLRRGTASPLPPMPGGSCWLGEEVPEAGSALKPSTLLLREGRRSSGTGLPACSGSCSVGRRMETVGDAVPDSMPPNVEAEEVRRWSSWLPVELRRMRPRAGCLASNSRLSSRTKKSTTAVGRS